MNKEYEHHGIIFDFDGGSHRFDFTKLVNKSVFLFPQHEVLIDLIAARIAAGNSPLFEHLAEKIIDENTNNPKVVGKTASGEEFEISADVVIGADGSASIARIAVNGSQTSGYFREYPFAWYGILTEAPMSSDELIYSRSEEGFVLISNAGSQGYVTIDAVQFLPADGDSKELAAPKESSAAEGIKKELALLEKELKILQKDLPPRPEAMSVAEDEVPEDAKIHIRGSIRNLGAPVPRGFIQAAMRPGAPAVPANESGRLQMAQWITSRDNPLTARVMVNRVWQWIFGAGIVRSTDNFGSTGDLPSHPELLDWLAVTFRDDMGGSLKKLHKLIVMSETYRQESGFGFSRNDAAKAAATLDAANQWLSHQNRRKLDAEAIRDSILAVSGKLDLTMGGPSFQDFVIDKPQHSPHYEYHLHDPEDPKSHRRSIYRFIVRSQQQPFMTVMDCADPSMRVDKRNESLSPLQALAMMNNGLTVAMAKHFAAHAGSVKRAFQLALAREPKPDELAALEDYAKREGLENTCRVILNLNEFSFVD
jgi:hypothetical protein